MKKWIIITVGILFLLTGYFLYRFRFVVSCRNLGNYQDLIMCADNLIKKQDALSDINEVVGNKKLEQGIRLIEVVEEFWPEKDYLLGKDEPVNFLVLLQNDNELRANGGFFGSYAVVTVDKAKASFEFQDIYVPDGQLEGHVKPPEPIQQAFKSGQWRLRDSDWSADFSVSAKQIRWFFEKGGEQRVENIVTLPLSIMKKIVTIMGPIEVDDYDREVTGENISLWLQNESEVDFFPGSTQKKDAINAAGKAVLNKFSEISWDKKLQIASLIIDELNHGNVLVNSEYHSVQSKLIDKDWAGTLSDKAWSNHADWINDEYLLIESNLGANKANCCVNRATVHQLIVDDDKVSHHVKVEFENQSVKENPKPPYFYGGNYIVYLRFYIPEQAINVDVKAAPSTIDRREGYPPLLSLRETDNYKVEGNFGFKEISFFHTTAAGNQSWVEIDYDLYRNQANKYRLKILKQHGVMQSKQEILIQGERHETNLEDDYVLDFEI